MRLKHLLACGTLLLMTSQSWATIVDGIRQKPTYETTGFTTNTEAYLYNVGAGVFFTEGNNWGTQASVGETGLKVKFTTENGAYLLKDYSLVGYSGEGWYETFFDSETALFVDRNGQSNYYFAVDENVDGTFRLSTSSKNPTFSDYANAGLYVGLKKAGSSTALSPFVDEDEAYVDWALVTTEEYEALSSAIEIYNKAQELKGWIDKIEAENGMASSLSAVYLDESSTMEQIEAAIESAQPIYIQALISNAVDKENVDVTLALKNPDYSDGENGWTVIAATGSGPNGRQGNVRPGGSSDNLCYEAWNNANFDIYQELEDMPVGVYEIEVQGFYRYWRGDNAWNAYLAQDVDYVKPQGVPVYVYLNNNATNFTNVYGDKKQITNKAFYSIGSTDYASQSNAGTTYYFPDGMASAAIAFSDGMYKQSAYGLIANEGDVFRIGVRGNSNQQNDSWVIWDNFKLTYRGFKAEVVQPILETAMEDLQQYSTMLMGKTEYGTLSQAFADAQTAIDNQNGEAMFQALNALYDVKESVIASKELFIENEVSTDLANLQEAIAGVAEAKLSKATFTSATTLETGIAGNTLYEGSEISQLKTDVSNAISAINNSVALYAQLNNAITALTEAATKKACTTHIDKANELLPIAQEGYNDGTIADAEVSTRVSALNETTNAINTSSILYTQLNEAIGRLTTAITEASEESVRIAKSTLRKANLRLTATQKLYDEGTIADEDIAARIEAIDQLIEELTHSIELYRQFAAALTSLQEALATEEKLSADTRAAAQDVYDTALEAYNEGTIDDDQVEAQIAALTAQVEAINASIALYADLAETYPSLEEVINLKALQTLVDEANTLYTTATEGHNAGTIANEDIEQLIADIEAIIPQVQASAELYTQLNEAIGRLEEALATEEKLSADTRVAAQDVYDTALEAYNEGTVDDDQIETQIGLLTTAAESIPTSVALYSNLAEAIASLETAVTEAESNVSDAIISQAQTTLAQAQSDYTAASIADAEVQSEIDKLQNVANNLNAAHGLMAIVDQVNELLTNIGDALPQIGEDIDTAKADVEDSYITAYQKSTITARLNGISSTYSSLADDVEGFKTRFANNQATLAAITDDLTTDNVAVLGNVATDLEELLASLNETQSSIDEMTGYLAVEPANSIAASSNIVELTAQYGTFCSGLNLDFTTVEGLKAYIVSAYDAEGSKVTLTRVYKAPAGTGLVVIGTPGGHYEIPQSSTAAVVSNLLVGVRRSTSLTPTDGDKTNLILANGSDGIGFYPTSGGTIAAGKAYLPLPTNILDTSSESRCFKLKFDDATRIEGTDANGQEDFWYSISGKKLDYKPKQSGIYIKNGRKVTQKK